MLTNHNLKYNIHQLKHDLRMEQNISIFVANSSDTDLKASVEAVVQQASPLPMPDDPDIVKQLRRITITFTAK